MQRTNGGKFLDTFWDLANEELRVRIDAAASLVDLLKQGGNGGICCASFVWWS